MAFGIKQINKLGFFITFFFVFWVFLCNVLMLTTSFWKIELDKCSSVYQIGNSTITNPVPPVVLYMQLERGFCIVANTVTVDKSECMLWTDTDTWNTFDTNSQR